MLRRRMVLGLLAVLVVLHLGVPGVEARGSAPAPQPVPGMNSLWGVHCRADRTCLAVGVSQAGGAATVVLGATGTLGPVRPVPATDRVNDITCLPTGNCLAVGSGRRGSAVVVQVAADGTPTAVRPVIGATSLFAVACPTATTCLATGQRVTVLSSFPYHIIVPVYSVITNGEPGPALRYPRGISALWDIDCPSATRCLAVGDGHVAVFTGTEGAWTVRTSLVPGDAYPTDGISCPSPTVCHAAGVFERPFGGGFVALPAIMALTADGAPGPAQVLTDRSGMVGAISCVAEWTCTLVGNAGRPMVVDVAPGQAPVVTLFDTDLGLHAVSCISATACGIVGSAGGIPPIAFFAWKG
jgi:hypothetical protein